MIHNNLDDVKKLVRKHPKFELRMPLERADVHYLEEVLRRQN